MELKWILYDVGNSAFILLVTTILPIYYNHLASSAGISEDEYLASWSFATSIATICVAILGPIMGTIADFKGNKRKIFFGNALFGSLLLFALWMPSHWLPFLILFVLAKICYSISLVVYDSMLVDICEPDQMDMVSSKGYAFGYIGSVIPFIISLIFVLTYNKIGISFHTAMIICFTINALWWLGCSLPLFRSYRQRHYVEKENHIAAHAFSRLSRTFRSITKHKKAFLFLLSFFFYIDGVYTIIDMATAYGTSLGLDQSGLLLALLVTQIVAFPFAILFGWLAKKYSTPLLIKTAIIAYICIAVYALFLNNLTQFWILAICVGMFQGGIQALSRSYFARIIPAEYSGEYFGLFDICGKGASFLGTMIVGIVTFIAGNQNIAIGCLAFLFLIGLALFIKVSKMPDDDFSEDSELAR